MALDEIRLWAADGSGGATPLEAAERMQSELLLEDTLVNNPDMLMPGLTLVGRQAPTEGGALDLLGVDDDGRLVVFELKRGTLSREAVAQVIDYASFLESMPDGELANYISERSGAHGIDKIEDFEEWYDSRWDGQGLNALKPVRMSLVGLGVDERTARMVRFLADGRIDISLLTFHGYTHEGKTLLARQVQVGADTGPVKPPRESREQFDNRIQERAKRWPDAQELWDATLDMLRDNFHNAPEITSTSRADWGNHRVNFQLRGPRGRRNSAAIVIHPRIDLLQVIFFRNSISLRLEEFTQLQSAIPSQTSPANSPVEKEGVTEIRFQLESLAEWEDHKDKLAKVTRSVYEAYYASEEEE